MKLKAILFTLVVFSFPLLGILFQGQPAVINGPIIRPSAELAVFSANNYLSFTNANGGLFSMVDSKSFTFSVWVKMSASSDGANGEFISLIDNTGPSTVFRITRTSANKVEVVARNSTGFIVLSALSGTTVTEASGWVNINICIDLANSSNRHFYFNGSDDAGVTWTTYTDSLIDFSRLGNTWVYSVAATHPPNNYLLGAMSEMWLDDSYLDSVTSFVSGGCRVNLGTTGQIPTGSAPVLYLSKNGSGANWRIDSSGNANNFTVNGTIGLSSTAPCP